LRRGKHTHDTEVPECALKCAESYSKLIVGIPFQFTLANPGRELRRRLASNYASPSVPSEGIL